jgi:hypothetical protein
MRCADWKKKLLIFYQHRTKIIDTFAMQLGYEYPISGHIAALFASCLEIANYPKPGILCRTRLIEDR